MNNIIEKVPKNYVMKMELLISSIELELRDIQNTLKFTGVCNEQRVKELYFIKGELEHTIDSMKYVSERGG